MKTITKTIFVTLLCVSYSTVSMAQNLRSMPDVERNALLISIAKEAVLTHGPDYYREYREPIVERGQMPPKGEQNPDGWNAERYYYTVTFLYDRTQETLEWDFAAIVQIWEDTGEPVRVGFGNGMGINIEASRLRSSESGESVPVMPFQQSLPRPIYDFNNPDPDQEPLNIDELIRRGLVRDEYGNWVRTRPDTPPVEAQRVIRRAQEEMRQRQLDRDRENRDTDRGNRR